MVDSLEPREWEGEGLRREYADLEITRAKLAPIGPSERELSRLGAPDDSVFDERLKDLDRPLKIEQVFSGLRGHVAKRLVYLWRPIFFVLRPFFRVVSIPFLKLSLITRFDEVQEVLARDDIFRTPFRAKAARLNWAPPFLLDQQYGADYRAVKEDVQRLFAAVNTDVRQMFKRTDLEDFARWAFEYANEILDKKISGKATAEIDAIRELVCRVPTRVCQKYYGVTSLAKLSEDELREYEDCFITVSSYLFGSAAEPTEEFGPDKQTRRVMQAAVIIRAKIHEAIEQAWKDRANHVQRDDVLFRMILDDTKEPDPAGGEKRRFDDARMTSYVFGMMLGCIPTTLMANGNMLEILFSRRPDKELAFAMRAAREDDDDLLRRYLFEAMRFRPLNPGPWRKANVKFLLAADTKRPKKLKEGWTIWPSTQSAMFDSRRVHEPRKFDVDRSPYIYMLYGYGLHRCIAKPMADAQITQTMKALFLRENLRPASGRRAKLKRISMFPHRMMLRYDAAGSTQQTAP